MYVYLYIVGIPFRHQLFKAGSCWGRGRFYIDKVNHLTYNILNKTADRQVQATRSGENIKLRNSRLFFTREQGGYFLWVKFRIDTSKLHAVKIIMNSSYVLISIPPVKNQVGEPQPLYRLPSEAYYTVKVLHCCVRSTPLAIYSIQYYILCVWGYRWNSHSGNSFSKPVPIGAGAGFAFDKVNHLTYNILNKTADTIEQTYPFPAQLSVTRNSTSKLGQSGGAIFYG